MRRALLRLPFYLLPFTFYLSAASAGDWTHWRGPGQNGYSLEKGLPSEFDPTMKEKGNVVWSAPFGGRSAPLVVGGRVYVVQGFGDGMAESERIVCVDENTGKKLGEHVERIYHSDVVSSRLGWTPLTADPATGNVFFNTTAGNLVCLDKDLKPMWQRQLTEEFGRFTGYGGRVAAPIFDSGLVIIGFVNSAWGDLARGANRYYAFDAKDGTVVWIADLGPPKSTYQSNPVIAVINGQRLLVTGGGEGSILALKVRTGQLVWSLPFSGGAVNPSPIVDGNLVYCAHGEENPGGGIIGRIICVDASQIDPATKRPKIVWDNTKGQRFGLSSPALADGVLYMPEDSGDLYAFDAKSGKVLWKYRYATEVRGAPLVADGKVYIFDVKGRLNIIKLNGKKAPDDDDTFVYIFKESIKGKTVLTETNGTPIAVNGRVYFTSRTDLFCLGEPGAMPVPVKNPPMPAETPTDNKVAGARLYPAEITLKPGETSKFTVVYYDANGREVKGDAGTAAEWSLPLPGTTPTGAQPPALVGTVTGTATDGTLVLGPNPAQQGIVEVKVGAVTARARVRVSPQLPARTDFDKAPNGASPGGWVNTNGKYTILKLPDGNQVLSKVNDKAPPPLAKAIGYVTVPAASDYTIQVDLMGTLVRDKLPDGGVVNSRYSLVLDGKPDAKLGKRTLRLTSWESRERINIGVPFDWQPATWYTLKLAIELKPTSATLRGKVWKKGDPEPTAWAIEVEDTAPNRNGAAGLYGYIPNVLDNGGKVEPGSELYFDNLSITPNSKK